MAQKRKEAEIAMETKVEKELGDQGPKPEDIETPMQDRDPESEGAGKNNA